MNARFSAYHFLSGAGYLAQAGVIPAGGGYSTARKCSKSGRGFLHDGGDFVADILAAAIQAVNGK